jgi:outer membrane protein OmpA-like peptidoglycan-associated protein
LRKFAKNLLLLLVFAGPILSFGQDFLPALNDNYMGINQALLQPAAIADSRFKSDWNAAGFSNDIYNDAIRFKSRWILYPTQIITNDDWWDENTYLADANGQDKRMFMSQSVLGPGFMVNLDPNSKFAIGFTSRVRSLTNIDGMDEPLFRLMYSNYTEEEYYNKWYFDEKMRAMQHIFGDYGITYAQVIPVTKNKDHFLKAGITLKLLQGIASSYLQTNEMYYYFNGEAYPEAKPISWNSPYVKAGISDNWGDIDDNGNYTFSMNYQLTAKPSVGFDLGVVYEFRKDYIKERLNDSTKVLKEPNRLTRPDLNKYFLKVGISLLDIGSLTYEKDYFSSDLNTSLTPDYPERYKTGDNSVPEGTYWLDGDELKFNYQHYVPFSQEMHQRSLNGQGVNKDASNKEKFYVKLPAAISLQADLNLFLEGLYVNVTTYWGIKTGYSHAPNSHYISNYSITPRYEHKWYGVSVPVQINRYGKLSVGLGARAGVFYFGVNNLFSNVFSDPYGISAYAGVKIPIHQKDPTKPPKEKDKKSKQTIVCCPCYDCCKVICKDTNHINKIDCLPGSIQITASHSTININSNNGNVSSTTPPAGGSETKPVENQQPESNKPAETEGTSALIVPDDSEVYFDFNSFKIRPVDLTVIDAFIEYLLSDPSKKARLTGYTDSIDTDSYNITLSKNRTQSVYNYMIQKGVKPGQIDKEWKGETNPKGDNTTTEGRQKNRRVEIELLE